MLLPRKKGLRVSRIVLYTYSFEGYSLYSNELEKIKEKFSSLIFLASEFPR